MDWSRAKSVLIIAFLVLNIVLGYQLWTELPERTDASIDWTSLPPETQLNMTNKGIRLDAEIPTETPAMRDLTYRFEETPGSRANEPVTLDPQPDTRIVFSTEELQEALSGVIPDLDQYRFDNFGGNEKMFVFNRTVDGWPIFDVKLELYYKNQKITSYRLVPIDILPSDEAKPAQKVLPATKAVANLIDRNYLPAGAVIKEIQLGYHGQILDSETQVSAPSWRVLLEDGEVFYVLAISGEAVTDQEDNGEQGEARG
ncbi:two-component system regulatory protein YycI [Cohnella lubricantis]|uniref:Two-component system regulatory protein YycI n=1 Tax=Cohnella lubricantis TaxID=2163172 RepID=A0A841TKP7_9BACL|nr:two-component system regulatory protein YycI [Cohnella lubricantis]MBB6679517.1 two-component system regulatory protein YycI [Cohnella lubricantis]MBP2119263.1 regulatory protein YycI of two-component signal transduction system YycFG [Cohnella lubricantis]